MSGLRLQFEPGVVLVNRDVPSAEGNIQLRLPRGCPASDPTI